MSKLKAFYILVILMVSFASVSGQNIQHPPVYVTGAQGHPWRVVLAAVKQRIKIQGRNRIQTNIKRIGRTSAYLKNRSEHTHITVADLVANK